MDNTSAGLLLPGCVVCLFSAKCQTCSNEQAHSAIYRNTWIPQRRSAGRGSTSGGIRGPGRLRISYQRQHEEDGQNEEPFHGNIQIRCTNVSIAGSFLSSPCPGVQIMQPAPYVNFHAAMKAHGHVPPGTKKSSWPLGATPGIQRHPESEYKPDRPIQIERR